jgi:regulator of cell morphogenesis and NO signaling
MNALLDRSIGELVAERPSRSRVFELHGIDYCCGGKRSLSQAASQAGVDATLLAGALLELPMDELERDWRGASVAELVEHILREHHDWLKENLPRIAMLSAKVRDVHGSHHPSMIEVARVFAALRDDLEPHLRKEEEILFPAALSLEATGSASLSRKVVASLEEPILAMEHDHEQVGLLLESLVELTDGFRPPAGACNTWRALYDGLQELDRNTRAHVHLENEVLHLRIRALDRG